MDALENISENARFYISIDADEILFSIGAGGEIPNVAAWDRDGYRPYDFSGVDYLAISREDFMRMVAEREPI